MLIPNVTATMDSTETSGLSINASIDNVQQVKHSQYLPHSVGRAQQLEVATLPPDGDISPHNDSHAGTVNLGQSSQVQQQLARAACEQFFQIVAQQLALAAADSCSPAKVHYSDVGGFLG